ncbi:TIR domain-containing adapter molecule 1 [Mastacembelus armatus]|uniref:Toll-like receptor adaptor molecule 1 n=1 Tax=Mastacembelus armatus TaxID=205130 RepID=A0A3Q3LP01_9TELE|nr:TIR domain-containing adapter molecule 1-like [Mastacembelus armatus]XP_026170346.1 TIR domain-containing adapter molecule 1-like [Mastacembelus armatus]
MSHEGQERQGTGLRDIFNILFKASPERLQSLTYQLGESPEENIIHILCLIILQRKAQALDKLQNMRDNCLANLLAEKCHMSGGELEVFRDHCAHFQELTGESLAVLARIFKVLSEQRLCDPILRNLAYQRALSTNSQKTNNCEDLEYDQLREEAKDVCGPEFAEWMWSPRDLKSYPNSHCSMDEGNTTLRVTLTLEPSQRAQSLPSPLQASSLMPSYPTHLEISLPPTVSFQEDKKPSETSDKSKLITPILLGSEQSQPSEEPQPKSNAPAVFEGKTDSKMDTAECRKLDSHVAQNKSSNQTNKPSTEHKFALPTATNIFLPKMPVPNEMHESKGAEEEEEAIFYAFVILHAPEDAEMADSMKEKLESVTGSKGATFSDDFAIPGKTTLSCVEDAINNSAFTILLLTCNFKSRMLELETNSALINSINNDHKFNTVIPLLPRENCIPRESIPMVLQTIVPLEENKSFEKKVQKALSVAKIKKQRKIWAELQKMKLQIERQERLKQLNHHQKQLILECKTAQVLVEENQNLLMAQKLLLCTSDPSKQDGGDGRALWQQQPNIHIENANYIMIGDKSQMTVDLGGGPDKDDSIYRDEEQ